MVKANTLDCVLPLRRMNAWMDVHLETMHAGKGSIWFPVRPLLITLYYVNLISCELTCSEIRKNLEILSMSCFILVSVFRGKVLISLPLKIKKSFLNPSLNHRFPITAAIPKYRIWFRKSFMQYGFHSATQVNSLCVLLVISRCWIHPLLTQLLPFHIDSRVLCGKQ